MTGSAATSEHAELGEAIRELVDIVARADRLGFCRWRVATALGASPHELALIEHIPAAHGPDTRSSSTTIRSSRNPYGAPTLSTQSIAQRNTSTVVLECGEGWPWRQH